MDHFRIRGPRTVFRPYPMSLTPIAIRGAQGVRQVQVVVMAEE